MPWCLILLVMLTFATGVSADGILVSERTIKPLEIPQQIGVVMHRDGMETLTVWNTVRAESQQMAWVLPLPAVPETIQETDPAAIRMLQLVGAPRLTPKRMAGSSWILATLLILFPALACLWWKRPVKPLKKGWAIAMGILLGVAFISALSQGYWRIMAAGGDSDVAGVRVLVAQEAGSYQTSVISGNSAAEVNQWLTSNGFAAFGGIQMAGVEEYIAKKWVFLCAKLKTAAPGLTGTHPLTVRFAAPEAVYPMRLTQGAGTVPVDLYVIGGSWMADATGRLKQITTSDIHRRFGREFPRSLGEAVEVLKESRISPGEPAAGPGDFLDYKHNEGILRIPPGRNDLLDALMGEGHYITHLGGIFTPEHDWSDITLTPKKTQAPPVRYRTRGLWAWEVVYGIWGGLCVLAVLVMGLTARSKTTPGQRPGLKWSLRTAGLILALLLLGLQVEPVDTVFVDPARIVRPQRGSADSFQGLINSWMRSITAKP